MSLGFSQTYSFKKALYQEQTVKMKGKVIVSDSIITIYTNGTPAKFNVSITTDSPISRQYKALGISEDYEIKFILNTPKKPTKFNIKSLLMETKDNFSGTLNYILYYLKEDSNE